MQMLKITVGNLTAPPAAHVLAAGSDGSRDVTLLRALGSKVVCVPTSCTQKLAVLPASSGVSPKPKPGDFHG